MKEIGGEPIDVSPEYEDCRRIARETGQDVRAGHEGGGRDGAGESWGSPEAADGRAATISAVTARVLDGKAAAREIYERIAADVAARIAKGGSRPKLATVVVGDDPASAHVRADEADERQAGRDRLGRPPPAGVHHDRGAAGAGRAA